MEDVALVVPESVAQCLKVAHGHRDPLNRLALDEPLTHPLRPTLKMPEVEAHPVGNLTRKVNLTDDDLASEHLNRYREVFWFGDGYPASERCHVHVQYQVLPKANLPADLYRLSTPEDT